MDRCDACRFEYHGMPRAELGDRIVAAAGRHAGRLTEHPVAYLRNHPVTGTWSVLEYGCHVRDVLMVQRERVTLALLEDTPTLTSMGPDQRAVDGHYNEQAPDAVAATLVAAAEGLRDQLAGLDDLGWARTAVYPYPEPTVRDVDWVARHTLHELTHHLADVDRLLDAEHD